MKPIKLHNPVNLACIQSCKMLNAVNFMQILSKNLLAIALCELLVTGNKTDEYLLTIPDIIGWMT